MDIGQTGDNNARLLFLPDARHREIQIYDPVQLVFSYQGQIRLLLL
ncbi:hypothetical protein [Endozoicomonas sp. YOMI1]|nr:hypothetical protein [Endozoicomonas sp. YOMI1]